MVSKASPEKTHEQVAKLRGVEEMKIYGRLLHYWGSSVEGLYISWVV